MPVLVFLFKTYAAFRNKKRTLENLAGGDIELSPEELTEIDNVFEIHTVKGSRYIDGIPNEKLHLWG